MAMLKTNKKRASFGERVKLSHASLHSTTRARQKSNTKQQLSRASLFNCQKDLDHPNSTPCRRLLRAPLSRPFATITSHSPPPARKRKPASMATPAFPSRPYTGLGRAPNNNNNNNNQQQQQQQQGNANAYAPPTYGAGPSNAYNAGGAAAAQGPGGREAAARQERERLERERREAEERAGAALDALSEEQREEINEAVSLENTKAVGGKKNTDDDKSSPSSTWTRTTTSTTTSSKSPSKPWASTCPNQTSSPCSRPTASRPPRSPPNPLYPQIRRLQQLVLRSAGLRAS